MADNTTAQAVEVNISDPAVKAAIATAVEAAMAAKGQKVNTAAPKVKAQVVFDSKARGKR